MQNPLIKKVKRLYEKASARKEENLFVVEGVRECSLLQKSNFSIYSFFVCQEIYRPQASYPIHFDEKVKFVSQTVYETIAYRSSSEGVIALAIPALKSLKDLKINDNPLILVVAEVEKPGNLGAMLRTADAVGADAVLVCDEKADLFNPNVLRSSLGTFFTNQVVLCSWKDARIFFQQNNIKSFAAHLAATQTCFECDFKSGTAFVLGSEAHGLSLEITNTCSEHLKIPMRGKIDSLNVSVSAAVLLYEAVRQRTQ